MTTSPPLVIETIDEDGTAWTLSFGGHNPEEELCINLPEEACWKLEKLIMAIDTDLLKRMQEISK